MLDCVSFDFGAKIMAKRKKKMRIVEKTDVKKSDLLKRIKKIAEGLYYISETDAEIFPFSGSKAERVVVEEVLKQTESAVDAPVKERDFNEFFTRLTERQEWFGEEEIVTADKFAELKRLLECNLRDLKVFKIGRIELDIYVVGLDSENNLTGFKTKAVET